MSDTTIERITVTGAGMTLSRLIWARFTATKPEILGQIYDMNPGLSDLSNQIPVGTVVLLPVPDEPSDPVENTVTLWS